MDGKEAIIAKIIEDAKNKANAYVEEADGKVRQAKEDAAKWSEEYIAVGRKKLSTETEEIVSRRKTVADLDAKKLVLKAKQEVLDEVFDSAADKLLSLKSKDYLAFVEKNVLENAEVGDKVILDKNAPIKIEDILSLPSLSKFKLINGGLSEDVKGGVILTNDKTDKDLSFKSLIDAKKQEYLKEAASKLFD